MEHMHSTALRRGLAATALVGGALTIALVGGTSASADGDAGAAAAPATITMQFEKGKFFFSGAKQVRAGSKLRIRNNTEPQKGGPHTFSLVNRKLVPKTEDEMKACGRDFKGICGEIVDWHEVDLQSGEVGRNPVEVGKEGWNRQGNLKRIGDSWVAEKENQSLSREVSAPEGRTLHFFCAIHPEMQGKIRVEG